MGTFVGDAVGMPFEGAEPVVSTVALEMREARLGAGTYTDDTQMMIALAESLIEHDTIRPAALARAFCDAYDPARGYGRGTRRVISLLQAGVDVQAAARQVFDGQGSRGNGAAMRVAPIAVRFAADPGRLRGEAAASAAVTHAHPVGIDAAVVQAAAIAAALRGEDILRAALASAETPEITAGLRQARALLSAPPVPEEVHTRLGSSSRYAVAVAVDALLLSDAVVGAVA